MTSHKKFFEKLSKVSDAAIRRRAGGDYSLESYLVKKRDEVKEKLPFIKKAKKVEWSV